MIDPGFALAQPWPADMRRGTPSMRGRDDLNSGQRGRNSGTL